ncbi:MAG: Coenzyme F420 hydrogenase/dehydrogenase, beta subunit C-terminal domain [Oceanicaulis sp.]|uniref:Coenzyme F420 hydrogenase/dehydrogenase, beta subunit C-terminal domain n=1 Tax=Glycocaulis sp. TaxID=1969725 RepID=UPI0025BDD1AC|nr:Coenzyme F420 hydrogenase/dehydrogenase, beta subunit C-terminal domain [Glycocaulis sp.]MCC5982598.1 Coenzyme F420 hydrogenase/dehydrogenase, beta subunit C-terminal domain [Oceanicaulis sp.]MCH8522407.1 Coenzyme F420 hydrogenase/dehydrogenase, beta subunit C-terminal domain [Glycocaulis sp.]
MLNRLIDRLTKKKWSEAEIDAMVGPARSAWLTYANDEAVRDRAASGGTTSALLIHMLETGAIDGAIVCRTFIEEGKVRAHFVLAHTREDILAARGSKYVETKFLREVLPILEQNEGRFAVCGLPCDITNLKRWEEKNPKLAGKVALRLAFLCGHNSRKELIDHITCQLCTKAGGDCQLTDYEFRTGHWRGELEARFDNGQTIRKPFAFFSDYRNLYFFAERKCVACIDHFGYDADIALGDVWLYSLRDDPMKHTGILVRTERAEAAFNALKDAGLVHGEEITREMILDGQTRIAPVHYNVSARSRAGKLFRVKVPDNHNMKVGPIKYFSAVVGMANMRWSEHKEGRQVMAIPRPLIRIYLIFKKGLETIK